MAQVNTPPWAKRLEDKIDRLLREEKCYFHKKYGAAAERKCDPPCNFAINLLKNKEKDEQKSSSLSPVVKAILDCMRPVKCLSPIKDMAIKNTRRTINEDIQPIRNFNKD